MSGYGMGFMWYHTCLKRMYEMIIIKAFHHEGHEEHEEKKKTKV